ncbi:MAG: hypothetical protein KC464_09180 [Myxococcales bacterium]|nr:hypothetical protein [Myxococcales bacterium]
MAGAEPDDAGSDGPAGLAVSVGGGVEGFAGAQMRDSGGVAGSWDVRAEAGTRSYIGFEAGYVGTVSSMATSDPTDDATLVSNGLEILVRANFITPRPVTPFVFVGAGWRRYDVTGTSAMGANVKDHDDLVQLPVGLGAAYRFGRYVVDARLTFRMTSAEDLVLTTTALGEVVAPMNTWGVGLHLGRDL